jgi:hypothetical protein
MPNKKMTLKEVKQQSPSFFLRNINKMKEKLKKDGVMQEVFLEYEVDIDELDDIAVMFKDLDVSAKCDHGIVYLNYKLLLDGDFEDNYGYAIHEITHWLQQTTGDKPTKSSDDGEYLDNEFEQEGFANQIKYIAENEGEDEAEDYVDRLLDHHDVEDEDKREELEEVLLDKVEQD